MNQPSLVIRTWDERTSEVNRLEKSSRLSVSKVEFSDGQEKKNVSAAPSSAEMKETGNAPVCQEPPKIIDEIEKKVDSSTEKCDSTWIRCFDQDNSTANIKIVQIHIEEPKSKAETKPPSPPLKYSLTIAQVGFQKNYNDVVCTNEPSSIVPEKRLPLEGATVSSSTDFYDNTSDIATVAPPAVGHFFNQKEQWFTASALESKNLVLLAPDNIENLPNKCEKDQIKDDKAGKCQLSYCETDNLVEEIHVSNAVSTVKKNYGCNDDKVEQYIPVYTSGLWTDQEKMQEFVKGKKKHLFESHQNSSLKTGSKESTAQKESNKKDDKSNSVYRISWRSLLEAKTKRLPKMFLDQSNSIPEERYRGIEVNENYEETCREVGIDVGNLELNLPQGGKNENEKKEVTNETNKSKSFDIEAKKSEILNNQTCLNTSTLPHLKKERREKVNTLRPISYPSQNNQYMSTSSFDGAVVAQETFEQKPINRDTFDHKHFVVVAVDFGTTFSGYAFSFTRDPENIHMMRKWEGGDPGVSNQKTPTCLLLTPEGEFYKFGFEARDYYHNLDPKESKKWFYFDKFKMTLHHQMNLNRETQLEATNGKKKPALTIFAFALKYFKDLALQELCDQSATKIYNEDIRWVITVPAIWRQPAKQFMRQAAYGAGLASPQYPNQLLIALEPEAASIYCRKLRMNQLIPEGIEQNRLSIFPEKANPNVQNIALAIEDPRQGTRYMVVDCGGGTVDITVHEMAEKVGTLKELHKASGGPYGSVGVDLEFEKLMSEIFGADFMTQFKTDKPAAYVDLMVAFEARKRNTSPYKSNPQNIALNFSFIDSYKKFKGNSVEHAIRKYGNKNIRWSAQGMLRLEPEVMCTLFRPVIKGIIEHIEDVLSHLGAHTIQYLFLVGGFAESQILQHEIRNKFNSLLKIMIPQGVSLAILRGAVLYGLDPSIVCVRRSRMTYGVGVLNRFIRGVHPIEKLIFLDKQEWCADVFDKFVLTDQSVGLGEAVLRSYTPATKSQEKISLHIYCSENDDAKFVIDEGVRKCGTLNLDLTDTGVIEGKREIQTRMIFGDTEIKVSALDVITKKIVNAEINFL